MLSCPTILENAIVPESYARVHYSQVKDITVSSAFCQLSLSLHYIYIYIYIYISSSLLASLASCFAPSHGTHRLQLKQSSSSSRCCVNCTRWRPRWREAAKSSDRTRASRGCINRRFRADYGSWLSAHCQSHFAMQPADSTPLVDHSAPNAIWYVVSHRRNITSPINLSHLTDRFDSQ